MNRHLIRVTFASLSLAVATAAMAQTTAPSAPVSPPAFTPVRWNEDYSYLKGPANRTDLFDPIKFIPLNDAGDFYASLGGQARYRYEYFNNANFGAGPQDDDGYSLTRLLAHLDLHLSPYFRVFVQGKSAMEDGREGGPRPNVDSDEADVQQLFVDFRLPFAGNQSLTLRLGRQELIYGAQRLISPADWLNDMRTFEGAKLSYARPGTTIDAFWVRPVLINNEEPNDGDGNTSFSGIYDTQALPQLFGERAKSQLELYALSLNQTPTATTVDTDRYTLGTRLSSTPRPWDFDVELDYQFGDAGPGDISAWSIALDGGYTFAGLPYTPRTSLGFDMASGDLNPLNPNVQTFNQLYPLGHAYFGYIDVIGRQNIIDIHPGLQLLLAENRKLVKSLTFRTDYHVFWRQSNEDAVYNAAGAVQRASNGSDAYFIGSELDLLLTWQVDRHLQFYTGYSHFFTGTFIQETGPSQDIDFVYAAATYTF